MSISIISNVAANMGVATSAAATAIEELPIDFAALLSAQTLVTPKSALLGPSAGATSKLENTATLAENADKPSNEAIDPSILAAMLGIPQLPPTTTKTQGTAKFAPENEASFGELSEQTKNPNLKSNSADSLSINKEISNLTNSIHEMERQPPSLASEAANIAADSTVNTGPATNFEIAMANATLPQDKAITKQLTVSAPLTNQAWPGQFSEKIVWLAKNDQQSAQININPPQLGPVQITLTLNGDQANAIFASPHAEVRQAIEASLSQLREMLSSAGISLGDASVGANLSQQNQQPSFLSANKTQSRDENAILPANDTGASTGSGHALLKGRGLVDLFA